MKRIKNSQQLEEARQQILQRQQDAENKIKANWEDIKQLFTPNHLLQSTLGNAIKSKTEALLEGDSVLQNTITYGLALLAKKATDKASDEIHKYVKKTSK
ncbi:MAG: hypothetical protein KA198_09330 [Chitinophagaceae bacterium]|nr:hypothetical protein [Chitinophagaceae bacterium]